MHTRQLITRWVNGLQTIIVSLLALAIFLISGSSPSPLHPAGGKGPECVACHMPATEYMMVDPRRDHSMRIPRPDLSVALGMFARARRGDAEVLADLQTLAADRNY